MLMNDPIGKHTEKERVTKPIFDLFRKYKNIKYLYL